MEVADPDWCRALRKSLIAWYRRHARSLPWRETRDPYLIWISEIMLQQTQVATVIPYYARFIDRFPSLCSLASADLSEVLRIWEGLGYYRRARQLHAAALQIVNEHQGEFPKRFDQVRALAGVGRYTAGAILSFAFDQRLPILEANTRRLYSRLMGLREPVNLAASERRLWEFAETILPRRRVGIFNQALMELGSTVCTPRDPDCATCPLAEICTAHALCLQQEIPGLVKSIRYEEVTEFAVAVTYRGKWWLRKRTVEERWAGLWDFPRFVPASCGSNGSTISAENSAQASKAVGFPVELTSELHTIKHGVTRFRITLHLFQAKKVGSGGRERDGKWFSKEELGDIPLTKPARRLSSFLCDANGR